MADAKIPPKPAKDTIYADVEDDITSIIDKVEAASAKVVALVLPKRAAALQSIVNMRLLARSAESAGKNLVLVTADPAILPLAGAARIHVAKTPQSTPEIPTAPGLPAEPSPKTPASHSGDFGDEEEKEHPGKIDYGKPIGELASAHDLEHPETIELGDEEDDAVAAGKAAEKVPKDKKPRENKIKIPNFDKFRLWLALGILGGIALIVFIIMALFVLPKATIAIQTTSTPVSGNVTLSTSGSAKTLDEAKSILPGFNQTKDLTGSQTVNATGQVNNGQKASGAVVMRSSDCSGLLPSNVAAGTGVSTGGLTYITQSTASFSPTTDSGGHCYYTSGSVNIVSQSGGAKYNTSSSVTFTVYGRSDVSASGSASGGTDNIQTVISQADVDGAKQQLTSGSSANNFISSWESDLAKQGYYVFTSTLKTGDPSITANPAVGQPGSTSSVSVKVTYSVLAVKKADLVKAITDAMAGQIDKSKQQLQAGDILNGATINVGNQTSPTDATLNIAESTSAVPIIDVNSLKKQVKGQKVGNIKTTISALPGVQKVTVKLSPFWVSKAPSNTGKITITTQHVNSSGQ